MNRLTSDVTKSLTEITYIKMTTFIQTRYVMKKNRIQKKFFALALLLFCICISTASAVSEKEDIITIDYVSDELVLTDKLVISGNAWLNEENFVEYDFNQKESFDEKGELITEKLSQSSGGMTLVRAKTDTKWYFSTYLKDTPPGDYIFRIWKNGDNENKITKEIYISPALTELAKSYQPEKTPMPQTNSDDNYFLSNSYKTKNSEINLILEPDLSSTKGTFAKGQKLLLSGESIPEKNILVWIEKKLYTQKPPFKKSIMFETDKNKKITGEGLLLSSDETKEMSSGQYFIYAITGDEKTLNIIKNLLESGKQPDEILTDYENNNPYQKFVMLLEEPWIRFDFSEYGELPQAVLDDYSYKALLGTTNLNPGTPLSLTIEPLDTESHFEKKTINDIEIKRQDTGRENVWTAKVKINEYFPNPGEYIVEINDKTGLCSATSVIEILDEDELKTPADENSLVVESYKVDQYTKDIQNSDTPKQKSAIPTAVLLFEGLLIICIIGLAFRKE